MSKRKPGYDFCIHFTRLFNGGKVLYHDHTKYCDKEATIRAVAFYLTCKDIKNVRVEYTGNRK